jgi:outer membrane protein OmpA-like peptidoglycan-associated protein
MRAFILLCGAVSITACSKTIVPSQLNDAKSMYATLQQEGAAASAPAEMQLAARSIDDAQRAASGQENQEYVNGLANIALATTAAAQSQSRANIAHAEADSTRVRMASEVVGRLAAASVATRAENVVVSEVAGELVLELDDLQRSVRGLSNLKRTDRGVELTLTDISFDVGKSQLNRQGQNAVATLGRALQQYPKRKIRLEGHTDATGSAASNEQLSQRRADAVRAILIEAGLDGEFVTTTALGETKPVASNELPDGRKRNRRVEIIIDTPPVR